MRRRFAPRNDGVVVSIGALLQRHHADRGRSENHDEQHRQEEHDHRHRELGGRPAAFFSASDMRMSRFSWATRTAWCQRRAVALRLLQRQAYRLDAFEAGALRQVFISLAAIRQIGQFRRGQRESSASATDWLPISSLTLRNAASIDMPDSTRSATGRAHRETRA